MEHVLKTLIFAALLAAAPALADPHTITMAGHGEVKGAPDQAQITTGVTTQAPTAAAALAANTGRMRGLFDTLAKAGIPARNIQTVNFSVSPQYTNSGPNQPSRVTGYQVTNQVAVQIDDIAKVGATLDALVTVGSNDMNGIAFSIKQPAPLLEQARTLAVADARARAETYARAAGVTLGPVLSISEGGGEVRPVRMAPMMMKAMAPVPVAAGEESVTADVSLVWEIH
jgi:uncharacterized protein YggE